MNITLDELDQWLASPSEDEHLEFKEAKNQFDTNKLYDYCVALANEGGGKLVLGVTDKRPRRVVGSQAFLNTGDIATKILERLHFRVDVTALAHPTGRVVVFAIPPRPHGEARHHDGRYVMRSGDSLVPMSPDQLRRIHDEGKPDWSMRPARETCSADNVIALLDAQTYFELMHQPYPANRDGVLSQFEHEQFIVRRGATWTINNLGAILFAKKLDAFDLLARKAPRVIVYEGTGKLNTRIDRPGGFGYAVGFKNLVAFISQNTTRNEAIEQALRREVKMYPELAIRELVANALIHQDFDQSGSSVMFELYDDRFELSNPGEPTVPTSRFIDRNRSRNERVADVMRRLGMCEEKGSGIDRVIAEVEVYQLPAPDFRIAGDQTSVVLFAPKPFESMDGEERVRAAYQHASLRYVMNQRLTNQSLRERFKLPDSKAETMSRVIRDAIDARQIKPDDPTSGSKRFAKYVPFWA
ncbi:MAG TPA: ATP-binding protein [Polyangiaceae bacterium]|jgi:ATP-dependent DNA helicase RecG